MQKRIIGVDVLIKDYGWNEDQGCYVYSFDCPACKAQNFIPTLGIYRCDCGSWLIVRDQL
ncbi:MAG TPA: hypothetical protein VNO70_05180 [Blastocatellia bacterium]|nr:hypothetical protein [Blastocatellia bacterium]